MRYFIPHIIMISTVIVMSNCGGAENKTANDAAEFDTVEVDDQDISEDRPAEHAEEDTGQEADVTEVLTLEDMLDVHDFAVDESGLELNATMTEETWYEGSESCTPSSMTVETPYNNRIVVTLLQIPADSITGTCLGHWAEASLTDSDIEISIEGSTDSSCWTSCWDFEVDITDVPMGAYTVNFLEFSEDVTVLNPVD